MAGAKSFNKGIYVKIDGEGTPSSPAKFVFSAIGPSAGAYQDFDTGLYFSTASGAGTIDDPAIPLVEVAGGGGGGGSVTSVAMTGDDVLFAAVVPGSPVTTSGTLDPTLKTQGANLVFAGPGSGSPAKPTFRIIAAADVPPLSGDVTGSVDDTVVALVGGSTAADVHQSQLDTAAATDANIPSTIVKRDSSGNFAAENITAAEFIGSGTGIDPATTSTLGVVSTPAAGALTNTAGAIGVNVDGVTITIVADQLVAAAGDLTNPLTAPLVANGQGIADAESVPNTIGTTGQTTFFGDGSNLTGITLSSDACVFLTDSGNAQTNANNFLAAQITAAAKTPGGNPVAYNNHAAIVMDGPFPTDFNGQPLACNDFVDWVGVGSNQDISLGNNCAGSTIQVGSSNFNWENIGFSTELTIEFTSRPDQARINNIASNALVVTSAPGIDIGNFGFFTWSNHYELNTLLFRPGVGGSIRGLYENFVSQGGIQFQTVNGADGTSGSPNGQDAGDIVITANNFFFGLNAVTGNGGNAFDDGSTPHTGGRGGNIDGKYFKIASYGINLITGHGGNGIYGGNAGNGGNNLGNFSHIEAYGVLQVSCGDAGSSGGGTGGGFSGYYYQMKGAYNDRLFLCGSGTTGGGFSGVVLQHIFAGPDSFQAGNGTNGNAAFPNGGNGGSIAVKLAAEIFTPGGGSFQAGNGGNAFDDGSTANNGGNGGSVSGPFAAIAADSPFVPGSPGIGVHGGSDGTAGTFMPSGFLTFATGQISIVNQIFTRRNISDTDATVGVTDDLVAYTTLTASRVVNVDPTTLIADHIYTVKDESGSCSSLITLTIIPASGTFDGGSTFVFNNAYGSIDFYTPDNVNLFSR